MAANTSTHFDRAQIDLHDRQTQYPGSPQVDADNLADSLYHHLIQSCHVCLQAIGGIDTAADAKKQDEQQSKDGRTAQHDRSGPQRSSDIEDVVTKENASAEELRQEHSGKGRSKFTDAVARLLLWGVGGVHFEPARVQCLNQHHKVFIAMLWNFFTIVVEPSKSFTHAWTEM